MEILVQKIQYAFGYLRSFGTARDRIVVDIAATIHDR